MYEFSCVNITMISEQLVIIRSLYMTYINFQFFCRNKLLLYIKILFKLDHLLVFLRLRFAAVFLSVALLAIFLLNFALVNFFLPF